MLFVRKAHNLCTMLVTAKKQHSGYMTNNITMRKEMSR